MRISVSRYYDYLDKAIVDAYAESLDQHIAYVQEAGRKIGVSETQLIVHDLSKWSEAEFIGYAKHFKGGGAPDEFAKSWLHHIHFNPHHWQYWLFPDGYTPKGSTVENGAVPMPLNFVEEMIADWMGAGRAYTGSWDMKDWLLENIPKIRVHSETADELYELLDALGYADIIHLKRFKTNP